MKDINVGAVGKAHLKVTENELAVNVGSGSLEVFATPVMVMLMEKSACNSISQANLMPVMTANYEQGLTLVLQA